MESKEFEKRQNKNLINIFLFSGILILMLISMVSYFGIAYLNVVSNLNINIGVLSEKFNIVYLIFQIMVIILIYFIGISTSVRKNKIQLTKDLSKKSLICSLIISLIIYVLSIGSIYYLTYISYNLNVLNEYYNDYNLIDEINLENNFSTIEDMESNYMEIFNKNQLEFNNLFKKFFLQITIIQVIIFAFIVIFNYLFFYTIEKSHYPIV